MRGNGLTSGRIDARFAAYTCRSKASSVGTSDSNWEGSNSVGLAPCGDKIDGTTYLQCERRALESLRILKKDVLPNGMNAAMRMIVECGW